MSDRYARGMEVRRAVLGDEHVDRAVARTTTCSPPTSRTDHALRLGRDLDAPGSTAHAQLHHADGARRRRPRARAGDARPRRRRNGLTPDEIRRCCSRRPSTAACPQRTRHSRSRSRCSRRPRAAHERGWPHARTQVAIVGAGPAGLTLAQLLHAHGVESVVLEARSRDYVERLRAGVLEQGTVDLLRELGVSRAWTPRRSSTAASTSSSPVAAPRADAELTGRGITIWAIRGRQGPDRRAHRGGPAAALRRGRHRARRRDRAAARPLPRTGADHELERDAIAGCDGSHGVCRPSIPAGHAARVLARVPYGWLGILAAVEPSIEEPIYAHHARGFALYSFGRRIACSTSPGRARRGRCELARRADLGGIGRHARQRMAGRSARARSWKRASRDAELRRRADAVRPAVPRRRRGAHRAADRRQGLNLAISDVRDPRRGARRAVPRR